MIAIVTYIQEMRDQGRTDKQCLGFKSRGYGGYLKNEAFVQVFEIGLAPLALNLLLANCLLSSSTVYHGRNAWIIR